MKKIHFFDEKDKIKITKLETKADTRQFYERFGIYEGAVFEIFFKNKNNLILKYGPNKLALSAEAAKEIFAEKITI